MIATVTQDAVNETYMDVEKMIFQVCWKFAEKFGGNIEDHLSVAGETYMDAYNKFEPVRGFQFTTYLWCSLWHNLTRSIRGNKIDRMTTSGSVNFDSFAAKKHFDLGRWLFELSEDANTVVGILLDDPESFQGWCQTKGTKSQKRGLIKHLQRSLGWSAARVVESFGEIRESLG